jgi:hypothetical protein
VSKPVSILGQVKGMARDFSLDTMPQGYVWDLVDFIPSQRGAQLEGRGPWTFLSATSMEGTIWSGFDAVFKDGEKLLCHSGANLYEQPRPLSASGTMPWNLVGALFANTLHNGKFYFDKVYWADQQGLQNPKAVSYSAGALTITPLAGANTPKAKLLDVWKGRLIAAGDPAKPNNVIWAPIPGTTNTPNGPLDAWDVLATWGFDRAITALGAMPNVLVVFHDGMTSRIKGGNVPPATGLSASKVDIVRDIFSNQYGCVDPKSVVPWQENLIFANSHGVMLTDGSTIRSLSDQGGIGQIWRFLYGLKKTGTQVSCGIYLDRLFCSILTSWDPGTDREQRPFTFVCDLASRAWYRLTNVTATCMIPSSTGAEQLWFGTDMESQRDPNPPYNPTPQFGNRLARIGPMYSGLTDADPDFTNPTLPSAKDDNQMPILPRITTGWQQITKKEGQKRLRAIYVSHATQKPTAQAAGNVLTVGYRLTPVILDSFVAATGSGGTNGLPYSTLYDRKRLPVGRPGYGTQVHVEQVLPSHISRLYDIGIEAWEIDQGRVS